MDFLAVGAYGYWRKRAKKAEAQLAAAPQPTAQPDAKQDEKHPPCTRPGCTLTFNHAHI